MTISTMDPHSTSKGARSCKDCHTSTKTLGLGYGNLVMEGGGNLHFMPATNRDPSTFGSQRLDTFVTIDGIPLVHTSRPGLRPFNRDELSRILRIGLCITCHGEKKDMGFYMRKDACPRYSRWQKKPQKSKGENNDEFFRRHETR